MTAALFAMLDAAILLVCAILALIIIVFASIESIYSFVRFQSGATTIVLAIALTAIVAVALGII